MTMSIAEISAIIENSTSLSEAYAKIEEIEGKRFPKINDPNLLYLLPKTVACSTISVNKEADNDSVG